MVEVADLLEARHGRSTLIIVGGSLMALHGLRPGTEDVDTSLSIDDEVRIAVRLVAERHQLAVDWLNDHSSPWHPRTLRDEECDLLLDHPRLRVLGAPLPAVFLMKLNRSGPQDVLDMLTLWPLVASTFPTARRVVDAFHEAFPMERRDRYLMDQVVDLARRTGMELPLE